MTAPDSQHPARYAMTNGDKPAVIDAATGAVVSYAELDARSNRYAHLFRASGLAPGDVIAVLLDNHPVYFDIAWGAQRAGLYLTCISTKLTPAEIGYIVADSGAELVIASRALASEAVRAAIGNAALLLVEDDPASDQPETPIADERGGTDMLYSSGTTGRPKGIRPALPENPDIAAPNAISDLGSARLGMGPDTVYFGPAPLYHAAPLRWSMAVHRLGGTIVLMERFDAEAALTAIERYGVTHSQWVPTHFVRLLKLPAEVRARYDHSTLRLAIHAAAPCPIPVKAAMIGWWGPILLEYYAGTEGNGMTMIGSADWLTHRGSVGRAVIGTLKICGEDGEEAPVGADGLVYFADGPGFDYHNDPEKTAAAHNRHGWSTLGDIGHVDAEGFLYLTDRQSFMIISGGVNVYPQEIENLLVTHERVMDAAVIGVPDAEMGECVVAVVQPRSWDDAGDALGEELIVWMRQSMSGVKVPRRIEFTPELPRLPTGKLAKRLLVDRYRTAPQELSS